MSVHKITPELHKQMLWCSETYQKSSAKLAYSLAMHGGIVDDLTIGMVMLSMLIEEGKVLLDEDETVFTPRQSDGNFTFEPCALALEAVKYNALTKRNSVF